MSGLFVTFEGGEGAGKSTQIALLRDALVNRGLKVYVTREPGGDPVAEGIRALLLHNEMSARAELLLFLAARSQNVESVIRPFLVSGGVVLCDRFIDSSVAYQGIARGLGRDVVVHLNTFATNGVIPDITFLLDIDPVIGLSRQSDVNRMEAEALDFHQRVREGFLLEAGNNTMRFCVLDASQNVESLHAQILARVDTALNTVVERAEIVASP